MKITPNTKPGTTVAPCINGTVRISHTQGIKQSKNFQTADCSYTVEIQVNDDPKSVAKGITRVEQIVEDALGAKLPQMCAVLDTLSANNGK